MLPPHPQVHILPDHVVTIPRSIYHLTMLCTPYLVESKGNIVNVSSVNGIRSVSLCNHFNAIIIAVQKYMFIFVDCLDSSALWSTVVQQYNNMVKFVDSLDLSALWSTVWYNNTITCSYLQILVSGRLKVGVQLLTETL